MSIPLSLQPLKHSNNAPLPTAGWLPSDDAAVWLAELARSKRKGNVLTSFPVAKSAGNPECKGTFLVPAFPFTPDFGPRVIPLYEVLSGVYIPVGMELSATVLEYEKRHFFPHDLHFFHPTLGSVGFNSEDAIEPISLLVVPPKSDREWGHGIPAPPPSPRLTGFRIPLPESPDTALEEAAGDISSKTGKLSKEKGSGGKLGTLGSGLAGGAILGISQILSAFSAGGGKQPPPLPGSPSQQESDQFLERARRNWESLFDARKREINRLLETLEKNPDEGLKYALPLSGGGGGNRGYSPPSTRLGLRNIRFSTGGGSGPADEWNLDYQQRLALEKKYRDAADRELAKGNFDRAAYILGNLIGDWNGAARALTEAGRYRDAVSIYLHKLNNKQAAANCYESVGQLQQAADLYLEMQQHEKAADLHKQLGNNDEAKRLWKLAAEQQSDVLQQARIWKEKLEQPAIALELLDQNWPQGNRSGDILSRMFELLQENQAVQPAKDLVERVLNHKNEIRGFPLHSKLELFHRKTRDWGDENLVELVNNEMWTRIAHEVSRESTNHKKLLALIPRLAPQDQLLERDVKRFSLPRHKFTPPVQDRYTGILEVKDITELPGNASWHSLSSNGVTLSFAGIEDGKVKIGEQTKGKLKFLPLSVGADAGHETTLSHYRGQEQMMIHFPSQKRLSFLSDSVPMANLQDSILAVGKWQPNNGAVVLEYSEAASLVAHFYSSGHERLRSVPLDVAAPTVFGSDWQIEASGKVICLAADGFFALRHSEGAFSSIGTGGIPTSLRISPIDESVATLVVNGEVLLISQTDPSKPLETVNLFSTSDEAPPPATTFLPDGSIAIAQCGRGEIFSPDNFLKPKATFTIPTKAGIPVGIATQSEGEITILSLSGKLIQL